MHGKYLRALLSSPLNANCVWQLPQTLADLCFQQWPASYAATQLCSVLDLKVHSETLAPEDLRAALFAFVVRMRMKRHATWLRTPLVSDAAWCTMIEAWKPPPLARCHPKPWRGAGAMAHVYVAFARYVERVSREYLWYAHHKRRMTKGLPADALHFSWHDNGHYRELMRHFAQTMQLSAALCSWITQKTQAGRFIRCYFAHLFGKRVLRNTLMDAVETISWVNGVRAIN